MESGRGRRRSEALRVGPLHVEGRRRVEGWKVEGRREVRHSELDPLCRGREGGWGDSELDPLGRRKGGGRYRERVGW